MERVMTDRYLRIVLTVIAIELGWLGIQRGAAPVGAQQASRPTSVVITGVEVPALPVRTVATVKVEADRVIPVQISQPVKVEIDRPVKVEADRPLPVDQIHYAPSQRPGE
jgi:hypothetical protein